MSLSRLKFYNWTLRYLLCSLVALVVLLPLLAVLINGLKTAGELLNDPFGLPREFHWANYTSILTANSFWQQLLNSLTVTIATTVLVLAVSSMAAFIFARISFPGREWLFNFYTLGLLFPLANTAAAGTSGPGNCRHVDHCQQLERLLIALAGPEQTRATDLTAGRNAIPG